MIDRKTKKDIDLMREGGGKLGAILQKLLAMAEPGVSLLEIDSYAGKLIREAGAKPSFTTVAGYSWPTCLCVNEVVVHGIPTARKLENGDILTIDTGLIYGGFHADTAWTKIVGIDTSEDKLKKEHFLKTGQEALKKAIDLAQIGGRIGDISRSTQAIIEKEGYSIVKSLVGHGVGRELHEDPQVPNYLRGAVENTYSFRGGETIAIEPIYAMGGGSVVYENNDGWTIATRDRSLAAVFEHSVAVTEDGPLVLTKAII
jgi:methionyl aminopeptidase